MPRAATFAIMLLASLCWSVAQAGGPRDAEAGAAPAPAPEARLEQMIGQMLIIGFPGSEPDGPWPRHAAELIRSGRIGGVILFEQNIRSPQQLRALTRMLRGTGGPMPPLIAVDQEGGAVQRLNSGNGFAATPGARQIAGAGDLIYTFRTYRHVAETLRRSGINVNLGPVVDLDGGRESAAIGRMGRSFDRDPENVFGNAKMFIEAHREARVLTAIKHFPGHGSSRTDTHRDLGDVSATWHETELEPYRRLIEAGLPDMVMVGHIYVPAVVGSRRMPAVFSRRAISDLLRGQLGFKGVVITDDLQMGAIRRHYGFDDSVIEAVAAGNDLLLFANSDPPDPEIATRAIDAVKRGIASGRIDPALIRASYARIMTLKAGLDAAPGPGTGRGTPQFLTPP